MHQTMGATMTTIFIVLHDDIYEQYTSIDAAFLDEKQAQQHLKKRKKETYPDWRVEQIELR